MYRLPQPLHNNHLAMDVHGSTPCYGCTWQHTLLVEATDSNGLQEFTTQNCQVRMANIDACAYMARSNSLATSKLGHLVIPIIHVSRRSACTPSMKALARDPIGLRINHASKTTTMLDEQQQFRSMAIPITYNQHINCPAAILCQPSAHGIAMPSPPPHPLPAFGWPQCMASA